MCSLIVKEAIRPGRLDRIKFIIIARESIAARKKFILVFSRRKWRKKLAALNESHLARAQLMPDKEIDLKTLFINTCRLAGWGAIYVGKLKREAKQNQLVVLAE